MIDSVSIQIKAGDGGDGHVSFNRLPGKKYGPPTGGDGGKGGDVYLIASNDLNTLLPFRFKKDFEAEPGENGGKNNKKGAAGEDLFLKVPVGTIIKSKSGEKLYDLDTEGKKILVVLGGKWGRGNAHLPMKEFEKERQGGKYDFLHKAEKGQRGEEIELNLELQVLADIGLIGLPNAGKSTLLSKLTAATPKIAAYPFTTLEPVLGVLSQGRGSDTISLIIADIPGLIEGASEGKGLGDQFLKHVERTKALVHLIAATSENPYRDYLIIRKEIESYDPALKEKKEIVALSKVDLVPKNELVRKIESLKKEKIIPLPISAVDEIGLDILIKKILHLAK